jgi:hypothetical protein
MTRLLCLLIWAMPALAVAQVVTTTEPVQEKVWEVMLKLAVPLLTTVGAPIMTKYVTMGLLKVVTIVPTSFQVLLSTLLGIVMGGIAGAIPDFPLTPESGATMGAASGIAGQALASTHRTTLIPNANEAGPNTALPQ